MSSSSIETEIRRHSPSAPWTYADLDRRQRQIASRVREGGPGAILLSEVAPVITLGRRTPASDLTLREENLARLGISVFRTDRGGLATYHGTGQWVLFAVDSLESLTGDRRGVRKAVCGLLEIARAVGREYDPSAEIRQGAEMGVWTSRGKFAALGIHIEQGVLLHGLAVNFFKTPLSFLGLRPCGLDLPVDFLLEGRGAGARSGSNSGLSHSASASELSPELAAEFERGGQRLAEQALRQFWGSRPASCEVAQLCT